MTRAGQWIIVTLGGAGVLAEGPDGTVRLPARRVPVVDTTGAGDTFCGVLAARLAQGETMPRALAVAVLAAGLSVQRLGAAASMPTRAEVELAGLKAGASTSSARAVSSIFSPPLQKEGVGGWIRRTRFRTTPALL
jgi:ribokinase